MLQTVLYTNACIQYDSAFTCPHLLVSAAPLAIACLNHKLSREDVSQLGTVAVSTTSHLHVLVAEIATQAKHAHGQW